MAIQFSKYGRVFDLLPEMIFILDRSGKVVDHNKAAALSTRYGIEQLNGMVFRDLVVNEWREATEEMLQSGAEERQFESKVRRSDGSLMDVQVNIKVLESAGVSHQVLIVKDITEQKKKELDLLRYSNVIHYTTNPIQITDAKGVMVYVNPAFERTSGYPKEELIGRNPSILSSGRHPKGFWKNVWEHILSGKTWVGYVENKRKDGSQFHTELLISPIIDADGTVVGFLGAHRDITEQKILEQQLVRSQKMEAIGTLAAGIAHEVGNPLTSISSLVQVIQRTTTDQFAIEKLELIKNQINRIARIIRDLVDFSRPSTHIVRPTSVNNVLRDALNIVQYGKKVKNIQFKVELADSLPDLNLVADQLVQVFINILMNAVDALGGKPGTIGMRSRLNGSSVEVLIADSGKGVTPEDREKIFEPFFTTKEVGKGTGLGLWVSYGIVKNFGGDITVESEPERGSLFTVTLPVKEVK
jgi:PAS domain S-box-containing protein